MTRSLKQRRQRTRTWTISVLAIIAVPVVISLCVLGISGSQGNTAAQPAPATTVSTPSASPTSSAPDALPRSKPVQLVIPAIGVHSALQTLSLNADKKTIELPQNPMRAGWYSQSATPGEAGLTVILGYITGRNGSGVFHKLGHLKVSAKISVRRSDGQSVTYRVDKITAYARNELPAAAVYADNGKPELRIITCGGTLRRGQPAGNVVVFADKIAVGT